MKEYECFPKQKVCDSYIYKMSFWITEKEILLLQELANKKETSITEEIRFIINKRLKKYELLKDKK